MGADGNSELQKLSPQDAKDHYGSMANARKLPVQSMPSACWFILVVELCERLAFYTFNGTISFFLERVGFSLDNAGSISSCMETLCFIFSLAASWVADAWWGKYKTIAASGFLYIIGCIVAASGTWPGSESIPAYFTGMLILIPMATAGIKSNLSNFGADQYESTGYDQEAGQERFFVMWYFFINIGSLLAYGFMTTFASNGGLGVPRLYGYFAAYMCAAFLMCIGALIFVYGCSKYRETPTQEYSALEIVCSTLANLARAGSKQAIVVCLGIVFLLISVAMSIYQAFSSQGSTEQSVANIAGFTFAAVGLISIVIPCSNTQWIPVGVEEGHPDDNSDVKGFLDILPVVVTANVAFTPLYNCMQVWYQQQACQMDVRLSHGFQLSGSFFNIADCMAIVLVTPLALYFVNPVLDKKFPPRAAYGVKFGLGMALGIASVLLAAVLEIFRRNSPVLKYTSDCAPPGIHMSAFPSGVMMVPYFLMGCGEMYCIPTVMAYAYARSPVPMRNLAAAVGFFFQAVLEALFALYISAMHRFIPDDLNHAHLEYCYLMCIPFGCVFYAWYLRAL